jgi:hypothetical protein
MPDRRHREKKARRLVGLCKSTSYRPIDCADYRATQEGRPKKGDGGGKGDGHATATNRPFDAKHFAWETPPDAPKTEGTPDVQATGNDNAQPSTANSTDPSAGNDKSQADAATRGIPSTENKTAAGHKRDLPEKEVTRVRNRLGVAFVTRRLKIS